MLYKYNQEAESNPVDLNNIDTRLAGGSDIIKYRENLKALEGNKFLSPKDYDERYRNMNLELKKATNRYVRAKQSTYNKNTFMDAISQILRGGSPWKN